VFHAETGLAIIVGGARVEEATGAGLTLDKGKLPAGVLGRDVRSGGFDVLCWSVVRDCGHIDRVCPGRQVRVGQLDKIQDTLTGSGAAGQGEQKKGSHYPLHTGTSFADWLT